MAKAFSSAQIPRHCSNRAAQFVTSICTHDRKALCERIEIRHRHKFLGWQIELVSNSCVGQTFHHLSLSLSLSHSLSLSLSLSLQVTRVENFGGISQRSCRKRLELVRAAEEEAAEALLQAKKKKRESSRRKVLEKTSFYGEPASSSASSCSMLSLRKGSKKKSRSKSRPAAEPPALGTPAALEKVDLTSLEKQRSSSARRGKMGTREVDLVPGHHQQGKNPWKRNPS